MILVVFRDVLIIGGFLFWAALGQPVRADPLIISKINTAAQICLILVTLGRLAFGVSDYSIGLALTYVVGATTLALRRRLSGALDPLSGQRGNQSMNMNPRQEALFWLGMLAVLFVLLYLLESDPAAVRCRRHRRLFPRSGGRVADALALPALACRWLGADSVRSGAGASDRADRAFVAAANGRIDRPDADLVRARSRTGSIRPWRMPRGPCRRKIFQKLQSTLSGSMGDLLAWTIRQVQSMC